MDDFYTDNLAQAGSGLTGSFDPSVWWFIFWGLLTFFIIYSSILIYHWFKFSMKRRAAFIATALYITIAAVLIFVMLAGIVGLTVV